MAILLRTIKINFRFVTIYASKVFLKTAKCVKFFFVRLLAFYIKHFLNSNANPDYE
jgi:hypothetical protein